MMESPAARPSHKTLRTGRQWLARAALAASLALVTGVAPRAQPVVVTKPIFVLPTLQWNDTASSWDYAVLPNASQLRTLLGGLRFGMTPEDAGRHLADRSAALHWDDLPNAKEYSQDVRYVWIPMQAADTLIDAIRSCYGASSSVNLLFFNQALFRISWRLVPDQKCPDVSDAAENLYAAFMPIAPAVAISMHYTNGRADVVDVTAPNAGPLLAVRWQTRSP